MDQMSREHTWYFTRRLQLLMADATIARELSVSYATLGRWIKGEGTPQYSVVRDLRELLNDALKEQHRLTKKTGDPLYSAVADAIASSADEPEHTINLEKPANNTGELLKILTKHCWGRKANSNTIFKEALSLRYTRMQCYTLADKLGIVRTHVKKGRGGYSLWEMPKRAPIQRTVQQRRELLNPKRVDRRIK